MHGPLNLSAMTNPLLSPLSIILPYTSLSIAMSISISQSSHDRSISTAYDKEGIDRVRSLVGNDPFPFIENGKRIETNLIHILLLFLAGNQQLLHDRTVATFVTENDTIDASIFSKLIRLP
jgi:hypothetical protein